MERVLLIEDEPSIADALLIALEAEGWAVEWTRLGGEGLAAVRRAEPALVVLDVGLPDISGFEVCRELRRWSEVPVLFLTARGDVIDRVVGLELGADDYVVKPFSPREVTARIRAILKRARSERVEPPAPAQRAGAAPGFEVERERLRITFHGAPLTLTAQEYRLLEHLVLHPGRVFSRAELLEVCGGGASAGYERNIDGHVRALRAKLRELAPDEEPLRTHRGFGYSCLGADGQAE